MKRFKCTERINKKVKSGGKIRKMGMGGTKQTRLCEGQWAYKKKPTV